MALPQDAKIWEAAVKKLRGGMMPPPGQKAPGQRRHQEPGVLAGNHARRGAGGTPYTGYVPLRRLNRREYANAVHDLIGLR